MHPHKSRDEQSNRTPTSKEFEIGKLALRLLVREFPSAKVVAVGKKGGKIAQLDGVSLKLENTRKCLPAIPAGVDFVLDC